MRFRKSIGGLDGHDGEGSQKTPLARFQERHYSVAEIAEMWKLSPDVVRKLFEREPGVLIVGSDGSRSKRRYHTLRISESVMERVYRRQCNPDLTPTCARGYPSKSRDHQLVQTTDGP